MILQEQCFNESEFIDCFIAKISLKIFSNIDLTEPLVKTWLNMKCNRFTSHTKSQVIYVILSNTKWVKDLRVPPRYNKYFVFGYLQHLHYTKLFTGNSFLNFFLNVSFFFFSFKKLLLKSFFSLYIWEQSVKSEDRQEQKEKMWKYSTYL